MTRRRELFIQARPPGPGFERVQSSDIASRGCSRQDLQRRSVGPAVALTAIIVMLAMIGLEVRKIDRQLAEIERLLSADDETANG